MYDTVLIPSDGSEHAVRAARHGGYLARTFGATIHLLNVVDVQAAAGPFDAGGVGEAFLDRLETEGEEAVETVREALEQTDRVQTAVVRGDPSETILEYAAGRGVDLIAMGTHGRTGIRRYIAGSVTERVLRLSPTPVLTVRATEGSRIGDGYADVLVPTDGSEHAAAAVDHALAIADRTGARIHAVNVIDTARFASSPEYVRMAELRDHLADAGAQATGTTASQAEDAGVDATTEVLEGPPARTLLEYADDHAIDLVVMGTAGRTGLDRHLLGSTTERVIRHADVPVIAVNANGASTD